MVKTMECLCETGLMDKRRDWAYFVETNNNPQDFLSPIKGREADVIGLSKLFPIFICCGLLSSISLLAFSSEQNLHTKMVEWILKLCCEMQRLYNSFRNIETVMVFAEIKETVSSVAAMGYKRLKLFGILRSKRQKK